MRIDDIEWNRWSVEHIARHGVGWSEVEEVVFGRSFTSVRVGAARFLVVGQTLGGRYLTVVVEREEGGVYVVVTARDADASERRRHDRRRGRR